jgi:membrane associated rhomboid family serine protease
MLPIRDHNPSLRLAYVTYGLIALNIAIHLLVVTTATTDRALYDIYRAYAMIPAQVSSGDNYLGLVTSVFLHGDILHLGGNMLFLWIFGDNLEDELGHLGFLVFYLLCGAGAAGAQWLAEPQSFVPTIGASGAIAGVMGGYLLLFPKARVDILIFLVIFIRIIPIPAWLMLGVWLGLQVVNGFGADPTQGGVAYWAHAGGFLIGFVLMIPTFLRRGGTVYWNRTLGHPPHPEADYGRLSPSSIPPVQRRQ